MNSTYTVRVYQPGSYRGPSWLQPQPGYGLIELVETGWSGDEPSDAVEVLPVDMPGQITAHRLESICWGLGWVLGQRVLDPDETAAPFVTWSVEPVSQ